MKLSRAVGYALQATLQLAKAKSDTPVPSSRLAADGDMPERFLLQILRSLVTRGVLRSARGIDGGYSLAHPPEETSLLSVIEAIDGPLDTQLPLTDGLTPQWHNKLFASLSEVTTNTRAQLEAIKLSQLLKPPGK